MATRKEEPLIVEGVDLEVFKKQKAQLQQAAVQTLASKIDQVKELLKEIQEISEVADVEVDIDSLGYLLANMSKDYEWTSSSY